MVGRGAPGEHPVTSVTSRQRVNRGRWELRGISCPVALQGDFLSWFVFPSPSDGLAFSRGGKTGLNSHCLPPRGNLVPIIHGREHLKLDGGAGRAESPLPSPWAIFHLDPLSCFSSSRSNASSCGRGTCEQRARKTLSPC